MTRSHARRRFGLVLALLLCGTRAPAATPLAASTWPASPTTLGEERADTALSALVPSREFERAAKLARLERDLARTLEAIDGVEAARVHIAARHRDPFEADEAPPPSASILLRSGKRLPVEDTTIRALVAGAVPGLDATRVTIVQVPATASPPPVDLVRVGPFSVTAASAPGLRALVSLLAALNVGWVFLMLGAWFRKRSARPSRIARQAR